MVDSIVLEVDSRLLVVERSLIVLDFRVLFVEN